MQNKQVKWEIKITDASEVTIKCDTMMEALEMQRIILRHLTNSEAAKLLGKRGGEKGGHARAASLTPERRSEIAKSAAAKRWKK